MATAAEKEVKTNWPVEDGITAGTTTQQGHEMLMAAQDSLLVEQKDLVGL